jgi:hypothetical protein
MAPVALSCRNTLVTVPTTVVVPPPAFGSIAENWKHAPLISRSSSPLQAWVEGVAENTTGALTPRSTAHTDVRVNAPKMLLSVGAETPATNPVNVVVTVTNPGPPQHAAGNAVPGKFAVTGAVAVIRLQLTGVTFVRTTTDSGIESPLVSHVSVAAVVTVLPGRCSGTPVSASKP